MKTTVRMIALAATAALVLSGCIKMEFNLELQSDDTVNGELIFAVEEGLGEMLSEGDETITDEEAAAELFSEDLGTEEYVDAYQEPYNEDGWVGSRLVFTGEPLAEFDLDSEDLRIYRDGDDFVVSGRFGASEGDDELSQMMASGELTMSVTFPGAVSEHNGTLEGNTVTWDLANEPAEGLQARGSATGGSDFPMWIIFAIIGLLVVAAIVVTLLVVLSKRGKPAVDAPAGPAAVESAPTTESAPGTTTEP